MVSAVTVVTVVGVVVVVVVVGMVDVVTRLLIGKPGKKALKFPKLGMRTLLNGMVDLGEDQAENQGVGQPGRSDPDGRYRWLRRSGLCEYNPYQYEVIPKDAGYKTKYQLDCEPD